MIISLTYQLPPSTTNHSTIPAQFTYLAISLHNRKMAVCLSVCVCNVSVIILLTILMFKIFLFIKRAGT